MNIKLITLEQAKIVFEVQIETGEHKKNNEMNKIFIGQNLWNNNQIVGQITNINFDNLSHNFEQNEPEKFDLKPKKVEIKIENVKIENESKILTIECFGDFKNCKWKSEWKFDTDFVLSPRIWEKNDNLPDLDEELKVNLKTNLEIQKNPKNLENKNLTNKNNFENQKIEPNSFQKMAKNEVEKQKNQNQKYYFIPTVQKFETVKMGQKLGFVEVCGNLYWLICPSWEPQYQIQIESGEFETSSKIGVLNIAIPYSDFK